MHRVQRPAPVADDATVVAPPRPVGLLPARPTAAPVFLAASPTVAPSLPPAIVAQLRAGETQFADEHSELRDKSLGASLDYGFKEAFTEYERRVLALLQKLPAAA